MNIATNIYSFDSALKEKRLPPGCFIEISGDYNSGKTTLALHIASKIQQNGGSVLYVDMDQALSQERIVQFVSPNAFYISRPKTIDEIDKVITSLIRENVGGIIIDSWNWGCRYENMLPYNYKVPGLNNKILKNILDQWIYEIQDRTTIIFFITKFNDISLNPFSIMSPYFAIRVCIKRINTPRYIKSQVIKFTIMQNKFYKTNLSGFWEIDYPDGYVKEFAWWYYAISHKIIQKNHDGFYYKGKKIAQNGSVAEWLSLYDINRDIVMEICEIVTRSPGK